MIFIIGLIGVFMHIGKNFFYSILNKEVLLLDKKEYDFSDAEQGKFLNKEDETQPLCRCGKRFNGEFKWPPPFYNEKLNTYYCGHSGWD